MDSVINLQKYAQEVTLEDGRVVLMRPIRPEDAPLLQAGYKRLTPETIYMRFFSTASELSDQQALQLSTVDYDRQMAFVGEVREDNRPQLVVVARYGVIPGREPTAAEVAIVVRDDYQSNGLGKLAMRSLILFAREKNINIFTGTIQNANRRVTAFIRSSGFEFERKMLEPGVWEYTIFIDRPVADLPELHQPRI